jgi:glycosyltransferase involved in cell wall biosynthesis
VSMNQNDGPRVSVVTPFYNTAEYLPACIESVLAQTYPDFEYLLVNNCSTDGSADIAERYARDDRRIRVTHNAGFLSQVQNYNNALRQISRASRYCKIVQADDLLFPRCLEEMVAVADAHPSIGIVGAYTLIEKDVYLDALQYPSPFVPGREICRRFLLDGVFVWGSNTATMLRADLVRSRDRFYPENSPFEDVDMCFELLEHADFGFVHQVLTFTRRSNESIMSGWRTFRPFTLMEMIAIERYGPRFLAVDEWRLRRRQVARAYYGILGEGVLRRRPKAFWDLHRKGLAFAGLRLSRPRVAWHVLLEALRLALNPQQTAARLIDRKRRRAAAPPGSR